MLNGVTFTHCSAVNGGAVYVVISGDPSEIEMSNVTGDENSASGYENTLYVVWKSTLNIREFSSFVELSEEMNGQAKVEKWNGEIVTLREYVNGSGGSIVEGSESESGYKVCAELEMSEDIGKLKVVVLNGKEEEGDGGEGCVVGIEGGEVSGEVKVEGGNGEEIVVDMGKEMTKVFSQCEDLSIVMNVTYGLSNG